MRQYLIIGNGVAANTAAENIRNLDKDSQIKIFTKEQVRKIYV